MADSSLRASLLSSLLFRLVSGSAMTDIARETQRVDEEPLWRRHTGEVFRREERS